MGGSSNKRDVIFAVLPKYAEGAARYLARRGHRTFYLSLRHGHTSPEDELRRANNLREQGVVPLPLEDAPRLIDVRRDIADRGNSVAEKTMELVPPRLARSLGELFTGVVNGPDKLRTAVHSRVAGEIHTTTQVNCWARVNTDRRLSLLHLSAHGLMVFGLEENVGLLVLPMDEIAKLGRAISTLFFGRLKRRGVQSDGGNTKDRPAASHSEKNASRAAIVTHKGVTYGDLFDKDLYYADDPRSELHKKNVLHLDYSGYDSPSDELRWFSLGRSRPALRTIRDLVTAAWAGLREVRGIEQLIGLALGARIYASFKSYLRQLAAFPELRLALIDYEVLCPMPLLLAFDAAGIKTLATQERFFMPFNRAPGGTIVDTYLCGSEFVADVLRESPAYRAENIVAVGQYRSDNLVELKGLPAPAALSEAATEGKKIVTALGFHTAAEWHQSQPDPLLNWSAHRHFIADMLRLARDMPNIFIVLRYKSLEWMDLPVFSDIVAEVESSTNVSISTEYDRFLFSYDLCAHSDLVIAKHTSLGDECLSVGIPVLFHEYTHNTDKIVADAFDYSPSKAMCFSYAELVSRAREILSGEPNAMTDDFAALRANVYGGLGDGNVRTRVRERVEEMLSAGGAS